VQKIKIFLIFFIVFIANNACYATCSQGETDMEFYPDAFKGHAVFVWKKSPSYSFAWLADRDVLISRKEVSSAQQVSECLVMERIKKMKGLKQTIRLVFINDPYSPRFINENYDPMAMKDDFLDLINRLEVLAEENQVNLIIHDSSQSYKQIPQGF
jgi:hypothetical protein